MFGQNWLLGFLFCQDVHVADQAFGKISVKLLEHMYWQLSAQGK